MELLRAMIALQCVVPPITHFTPEIRLSPTTLPAHSQAGLLGVRSLEKCKPQCALCRAPRFQLHHLSLPVAAQQGLFHTQPQHSRRPQERNPSIFWRDPLCFMYQRRMTLKIEFFKNSWPLCICDTMLRSYLRSVSMVEAKQRKNGNIDITYTVSFQKELKAELFQNICWDSL